ncbi:MAG: sugar transferase [Anaerolineales bacterium]|nr:sugar transferase [Anaerolineales bacterium]
MKQIVIQSPLQQKKTENLKFIPTHLQWRYLTFVLLVGDLLLLGLAFRLAYFIRFETGLTIFQEEAFDSEPFYQRLVMVLIPLWLVILGLGGAYDRKKLLVGTQEYSTIFNSAALGTLLIIAFSFIYPDFILSRGWLFIAWGLVFFLPAAGRFLLRRFVYLLRREGYFVSNAIIVGANNEGISLASQFKHRVSSGLVIRGFIDKKIPVGKFVHEDLKILGDLDQIDDVIEQYKIEEIILASSAISTRDKVMEIFQKYGVASNVNVRLSSGLYEIITTGLSVQEIGSVPMFSINQVRLTGIDVFLKAMLDYCITIPGLLAISPFFLFLLVAIKLDSPGPAIHRRRVMGVNGEQFDAFKFRTMYVNGDEILAQHPELKAELEQNHKLKNDPRITRIGHFLRKTSLDELPQLLNVLKRDMSLVGPRIIAPDEMKKYSKWDINLLTVHPGITGLWQVSGRSDLSYKERVNLDMYYIRNWSIWLDLQILFQTIPVVLKGTGAY